MIECDVMQDRMPAVARGESVWTDAEASHMAGCADCAHEWQIVLAGAALHEHLVVSADRVAETVLARLQSEPAPIRRIPWRGSVIGLLAAAASVLIIVYAPRADRSQRGSAVDTTIVSLLPELQGLDDGQLDAVLRSLVPAAADATAPADTPHLDDLTNLQLERLLHAMGGE